MFDNWNIGDWIGVAAIIAPFLLGGLWHAFRTARILGQFEARYTQMTASVGTLMAANENRKELLPVFTRALRDVDDLKIEAKKYASVDTSLQLLQAGLSTMATAVLDLRNESRSGRVETQELIAEVKRDFSAELTQLRSDVRGITTGDVNPVRRRKTP